MKKLGKSVFPAAMSLWSDAGNASSSLSSSDDFSQPRGEPVNVAIVEDDPHDRALPERMVGRSSSLGNVAWQHRMNLPPCTGIKRAESTDLTDKAVAGAGADISSVADWIGEIKKVWARGSSSTLDLARVVSAAKTRLQQHYGQWSRLWKSDQKMPLSKSTARRTDGAADTTRRLVRQGGCCRRRDADGSGRGDRAPHLHLRLTGPAASAH